MRKKRRKQIMYNKAVRKGDTTFMIWFTSDLHIGHNKGFLYEPRGFKNIYDHDQAIIDNWNSVVKEEDLVYVLGDLMLNDNDYGRKIFNQLVGQKIIIYGNHDTDARLNFYQELRGVQEVKIADMIKIGKHRFYLSHYPTYTACFDKKPLNKHLINLSGHTHYKDKFFEDNPYIYNVALDAHDMKPVTYEEIIQDIQNYLQDLNKTKKQP